MPPIITCKNLSLSYEGKVVLSNLNFTVDSGDYFCVLGGNGSGKSTLIKAVLGLKKPSGGEITIDPSIKKKNIGYLPQNFLIEGDFPATTEEVVLSGFSGKLFLGKTEKEKALEIAKDMGIDKFLKKSFSSLSGGQKQRTLLARALCAAKDLFVLDEPAASLDSVIEQELYDIIEHLNKNHGMTIIMVTHNAEIAKKYATKILTIGN